MLKKLGVKGLLSGVQGMGIRGGKGGNVEKVRCRNKDGQKFKNHTLKKEGCSVWLSRI
jgi:hypothetical protein